jgi:hypothetical protein
MRAQQCFNACVLVAVGSPTNTEALVHTQYNAIDEHPPVLHPDPPAAEETVTAAKHALKPSLEQRGEGSESTVPGNNGRIQAVPFWG